MALAPVNGKVSGLLCLGCGFYVLCNDPSSSFMSQLNYGANDGPSLGLVHIFRQAASDLHNVWFERNDFSKARIAVTDIVNGDSHTLLAEGFNLLTGFSHRRIAVSLNGF